MTKRIQKPSAILAAIIMLISQASFMAMPVKAAGNASLSLGETTLRNGCPGSIPINIDTGGEDIWAADVGLYISGSSVAVDSLTLGPTLPMQACNDISDFEVMLCGARQAGTSSFNGQGVYGTIDVTPRSEGTISLSFNNSVTYVINDDIQDALGSSTGADYTVEGRFNVEVDGRGFCDQDTTAPIVSVSPQNGQNNVPVDTSVTMTLSDDRSGVDFSTFSLFVNGIGINTSGYTKTGGTYTPSIPFELGEKVVIEASICDMEANCRDFISSFRTAPPPPPANCGDRNVDEGEQCDDGYQTGACDRDCTFVTCGDGIINDVAGEQCDDLNEVDGDGCSSICALEGPVVEDKDYVPVLKPVAPVCPDIPEPLACEELIEIAQEIEPEIEPPEPEIEYSMEEIEEKAVEVLSAEVGEREAPTIVELPEEVEDVMTRIDECKEEYIILDFESSSADADSDGLSNKTECYLLTSPLLSDTDDDGCLDGDEINQFVTDPLDPEDCNLEESLGEISISSPQAGWLLSELEVTGITPDTTSKVNLIAFHVVNGQVISDEPIELDTISKFNPSSIEDQYHFKSMPEGELADGETYDLIAIGVLADGQTITSAPIRFSLDSEIDVEAPAPATIGNVVIDEYSKLTNIQVEANDNGKIEVTGGAEYGSQVFAVWESVVLASSVIADSALGEFSIESPRPLGVDEDHMVTLFAIKNSGGQKLKSKNVGINFYIKDNNTALYILLIIIILTASSYLAFNFDMYMQRKKKGKAAMKKLSKGKILRKRTKI